MFLKALSTPTFVEISRRLRGLTVCLLDTGVDHLIKDCPKLDESRRARVASNQANRTTREKVRFSAAVCVESVCAC